MELKGKVSLLGKALLNPWLDSKVSAPISLSRKIIHSLSSVVGLVGNSHEEYYPTRKGQATESKTCVLAIESFEVAYRKCRE